MRQRRGHVIRAAASRVLSVAVGLLRWHPTGAASRVVLGAVGWVLVCVTGCSAPSPTLAPAPVPTREDGAAPTPRAAPTSAGSSVGRASTTTAATTTSGVTVLHVTTAPGSPNDQPLWVAIDAGLMRARGLDIQLVNAPANQGIASLVSGSTDIASTGGAEALGGLAGGADLVIVANLVPVIPWQFYGGPGVGSVSDLRGKKIGITTAGASYDTALRLVLPKFGLDPDRDVTLITTGSIPNVTAALFSGAIDGAPLVVTPASFRAIATGGFHEIFDFAREAGAYPGDVTVVRRDWLASHREVVQGYVDGLVQAVARFKRDRPYAIRVSSTYLDEPDLALVGRTYDYFASSVTPSQPSPTVEQFTAVLQSLSERNEKARGIDLAAALDASFVESAVARGLDR